MSATQPRDFELSADHGDARWVLVALRFPGVAVLTGERRGQGTTQTFPEVDVDPDQLDPLLDALAAAPAGLTDAGNGAADDAAATGDAIELGLRVAGREVWRARGDLAALRATPAWPTLAALLTLAAEADPAGAAPPLRRALDLEGAR